MKFTNHFISSIYKLIVILTLIRFCLTLENKLKTKQNDLVLPIMTSGSDSNFQGYSPTMHVIINIKLEKMRMC
jgi:hypothetical protein